MSDIQESPNVTMRKETFHFKREKLVDSQGNKIGEGKKHPSVDIFLPIPSDAAIAEILKNKESNEYKLLQDAITTVVFNAARAQMNEIREADRDAVITQGSLNMDKLSWKAIADTPKGQRGSSVPAEEDFAAFFDAYKESMPSILGKDRERIENHCKLFESPAKVKDKKEVLEHLLACIDVFIQKSEESVVAEHDEVLAYLINRINKLLKREDAITMDDL